MSYVLNGIKTAMVEAKSGDRYNYRHSVTCPCGWVTTSSGGGIAWQDVNVSALRFHYTHCPQAKVAPEAEMREAFYTPAAYFARHPKP